MTGSTTTVGIEVRADGTQEAARDLAVVDASLKKIQADLGETAQPAGVAAQGFEQLGAAGRSAGAGLGAVGASAKKAAEGLGSVSKFASTAKFDKVVSDLGTMGVKLNTSSLHAQKLARAMQQVERERAFQQLAADANLSTLQLAKFRAELGDTRGALATLTNGFGLSKAAVLAFAAALAFGGKAALDAALQMDRLSKAYTTITGSSASAQQQLSYLYDVSNRLGLQFQSTAEAAKTFFAAGKGTTLEKDMNGIFEAVSSAGAALSLSTDDIHGAFLALGQMISKGKVQAEELRGQLGERLPGAFQLAAKAMNMTTAELDKFMADGKLTAEELLPKLAKVMQEDFGTAAEAASQGLQGAINRLSTEWTLFKSSLVDSDAAVAGVNAVRGAVGGLQAAFDLLAKYKDVFKALAVGAGITTLISLVPRATEAVLGLASAFKTLLPLVIANPWVWAAAAIGAVAAGIYYYSERTDVATQAQRELNDAQELSIELNKKLAEGTKDSADGLDARTEAAKKQLEALQTARQSILDSMSPDKGLSFDSWNRAILSANKFIAAIEQAKDEASKTGDFKGLEEALKNIELEARAAGQDTDKFKSIMSDARAVAALGIKLDISIGGMEKLYNLQSWLRSFVGTYGVSLSEITPNGQKTDWKEQRDSATQAALQKYEEAFTKTDSGRLETLRAQKKEYQDQLNQLGSLLLTDEQRNRQSQILNGLLKDTDSKIKSILNKGQKKDNALEQAQRDLDAYNAELGKTEASIRSLRAQLATKPGELFTREQAKIAAEYEATLKQIDKQASDYARKKGISTEQARQLKSQKEIEAGLKRDLALREAQEKEEKRLADLAKDRYEFYKELEEITGQYGLSLKFQSEVIAAQVKELERLQIPQQYIDQWRQLKELQSSKDWADGAVRGIMKFKAEASDTASQTEDAFSGLFSGIQSSTQSMWEDFLETGKLSLSSLKSVFKSFIAQLLNIAVMNPIIVQVATSVQGSLWGSSAGSVLAGTVQSGSGGVGGLSNLSGLSNLMPSSWFSGIGNTINDTMAGWFPSTFGATAYSGTAGTVMSATGGAADIAGLKAAEAAMLSGNTSGSGMAASQMGTFTQAVAPYLMAGGLGSLGYTMLGGALGLPQSKYSGLTAGLGGAAGWGLGSLAAGSFASIGATAGSVIPVVGTIIGALAGGALGSLFGQKRKTHPSVYGHMMGLGYTTDTQTYIDAFMEQATYDRAGKTEASAYAQVIGEAASQTAGNILDLAAMLPEAYKQSVEEQLASATWSAGRGYSGASWNLQNWKEGMAEERIQEAVDDMFAQMGLGANKAFAEAGIGELFDSFDLSTEAGFKKAQTAISAISSITTAIDEIKAPTTEAERQAKAFIEQMDALGEAVKASGLNAAYADKMLSDYRTAYVDKYVKTLEEMFNPLSQIEQQAKGYKEAIDGYVSALTTMGASEAQLAQVRGYTQDAIDSITGSLNAAFFPLSDVEQQTKSTMESLLAYKAALETLGASAEELTRIDAAWGKMQSDLLDKARAYVSTTPQIVSQTAAMNAEFDTLRRAMELAGNATADLTELERTRAQAVAALQAQYAESFRQTYAQRYATLTGDTNGLANLQQDASHRSELAEIEKTWGKDSLQYKQMQALQEAEAAKLRLEQAQAAADKLAQLQLEREKLVMQTSVDSSKARLDALKVEKSAAEKLKSAWEDVLATIYKTRLNMYQSDDNLDLFGRLATAQGEFDRLYGLAIGGDADAAKEMASVSSSLLDLRKETSATSADYLDAFYGVDKKLKDVSGIADKQVSAADRQLAVLGSQLSVQEAQYGVLSAQLSALGSQNSTLASIDAQIAGLKGVLSGLDSAKGDYQSALDKVNEIKPNTGVYGSNYLTEYDLMAAKVASLNRGEYIDPNFGIPAGGWTIANARQAMLDTYGSVPEWYKNAGKIEGFAKGGLASGWGIAGEYGPELIDFSTPGRVYTAEQTRQILMPPAVGTDGSLVAEIAKLREQNKEMARELRIANARLEKMEKYAKETKDAIDNISVVGIPTFVEA